MAITKSKKERRLAWAFAAIKAAECLFLARLGPQGRAEPGPLCPGTSDIDLFYYGKGIIDFNAEIPDSAFNLGMAQQ